MKVISYFRNNARTSLTKLSRITKIPVSTIFDKLKEFETTKIILKHTALIDFKNIGYAIRSQMLITAPQTTKNKLQEFLVKNPKVNTIFRINNGYDFLVETIFKTLEELDEFTKELDHYEIKEKKEFFIMEDIKREEFLTYKENIGILK